MTRNLIGLLASLAVATALVAAQGTPPSQTKPLPQPADVTLTGCLIQGSAPAVFILDHAKPSQDGGAKAQSYRLESAAEDLDFVQHVNHEVSVTGWVDLKTAPTPPAGQKIDEKDLPKLSAKSLTMVADKCMAASR